MAIETNIAFLDDVRKELATQVTAADMEKCVSSISNVLSRYELFQREYSFDADKDDLMDAFIAALEVQGRSKNTIKRYKYILERLLSDLQIPIRSITVYHLRSWIAREKKRGISDQTLESNRQIFSSFFSWLWREGLIERNPVGNLGTIKTQKKVKEAYADVDVEKLKAACSSVRNIAIVTFLLATGCRIGEVVRLNRDDIDFTTNEVIVLGKGNKERTVFFDDVAAMHLLRYLESRKDNDPALFLGKKGVRLLPNGIRTMLKKLAQDAGVEHVHPHKFRRTLATALIAHGMPIQEVAAILGHEKLDTTMKYVVLDKSNVKNSYRRYA